MERKWWKEAVVYQIYPRSFYDSNGDGIGDLGGIHAKLDYLRQLGVDVLWLSPVYKSPNADNGYDISDYCDIMPEFGSLAEMDGLIAAAHRHGLRLIMDLVPNHTSDEHPWFVASRRKESPYRDYYYWRPGRDGAPPNNWEGYFGGSTWTFDPVSNEYYLHLFTEKQPDLNWENPRVRQDIYEVVRWWLNRGVDGFRIDCANLMSKAPGLPDGVPTGPEGFGDGKPFFVNGPRIHEFLRELNEQALSGYDIMTVGETSGVTPEVAALYVNEDRRELNMVFSFEHMDLDREANDKWVAREWPLTEFKSILRRWHEALSGRGWNSFYLNNHDQPRAVSRFADDGAYRAESAKLLATLTLTLPGTPFLYQGEEIGMTNVAFTDVADYRDVDTLNAYHRLLGRGLTESEVLAAIHRTSRDNARTPMQWSDDPEAGFTTGTPWIKVNPNYPRINVADSVADSDSVWHYYRNLIALRKRHPALVYGDYQAVLAEDERVHAYLRSLGEDLFLMILNFSPGVVAPGWPKQLLDRSGRLLICNYPLAQAAALAQPLRPFEARLYRME